MMNDFLRGLRGELLTIKDCMMHKNDFLRMSRTPIDDMREAVDKMTVMSSFQDDARRAIDSQNFYQDTFRRTIEAHDSFYNILRRTTEAHDSFHNTLRRTTEAHDSFYNTIRRTIEAHDSFHNTIRRTTEAHDSFYNFLRLTTKNPFSKIDIDSLLGIPQESIYDFTLRTMPSFSHQVDISHLFRSPAEDLQDAVRKMLEPLVDIKKIALSFADNIQIPPIHNFDSFYKNIEGMVSREAWLRFDLKSGFWIIEDDEVITHLKENLHTRVDQEYYICDYYSKNEWDNLATIVEKWAECEPIRDRHPILKDCFTAVKLAQGQDINIANLVVPTLLAQIDGIRDEILEAVPDILSKIKINVEFTPEEFTKKNKKIKFSTVRSILSKLISDEYGIIFYEVICEGIFQCGYDFAREKKNGENLNNMNRNKIQHGDKILLDYGTRANLIRAFLCVDFMIKVIVGIQNPE